MEGAPGVGSVSALLRRAERYLAFHRVEAPAATAEALLLHTAGIGRTHLHAGWAAPSADVRRRFARGLCRRAHGTPLEHITKERQFLDLLLEVRPDVFIPRPETEVVVEATLATISEVAQPIVVDVGTGAGAIALAVKRHRPDARVLATDVSTAAVELASDNARRLGLDVDVRHGDLVDPIPEDLAGAIGALVSNPPYVEPDEFASLPPEVRAEPYEALVGGTGTHERLVGAAPRWLAPHGALVCEVGADQGAHVAALFRTALEEVRVLPDLAGRDRVVAGRRPAFVAPPRA